MDGGQGKADGGRRTAKNNNKEKNNFFCPFPIFAKPVDRWHLFGSKLMVPLTKVTKVLPDLLLSRHIL